MAPPAVDGSANPPETDDVAAAEADAALAEQRAQAARARAAELRRQAGGHPPQDIAEPAAPTTGRSRWWRPVAVALAAAASCGLLGVGSALAWKHHVAQSKRAEVATAAEVARQGITDLMALNFVNAEEDVQRIVDNATGTFKKDFETQRYMMVKHLLQSKAVTKVSITGVAVQSATADSAEVLVSVISQAANITNPQAAAKRFRVAVDLAKDQGRLKISKVAFI